MRVPFKYRTSEHTLNACLVKGCPDGNEAGYFEGKNYIWPWVEILGQRRGNTPYIQNYFTWYPSFPDSKSLDNIFTQKYPYSLKKIFLHKSRRVHVYTMSPCMSTMRQQNVCMTLDISTLNMDSFKKIIKDGGDRHPFMSRLNLWTGSMIKKHFHKSPKE